MISFNSYGEWIKYEIKDTGGNTYYIELDTIKEHGGYVYYWELIDLLKPLKSGTMSSKAYKQGDCGVNRYKELSVIFNKQPMGEGSGETYNPPDKWRYPTPGSIFGDLLMHACIYAD